MLVFSKSSSNLRIISLVGIAQSVLIPTGHLPTTLAAIDDNLFYMVNSVMLDENEVVKSRNMAAGMEQNRTTPKDAQVMASILKEMGVNEYEPRVINQMLDFSYSEFILLCEVYV